MKPGQSLGGYRLIERLGIGGAGTVWLAEDEGGMRVALKTLHPALAHSEQARTRLVRETQNVNAVRCDSVAHVLDVEVDDAQPFIVSEFIEGPTLSSLLREGPLEFNAVIELAQQLHVTLEAVHKVGIVHRDVKPGNVIMSPSGPILIDFGIAQSEDDDPLTVTGFVSGTAGYASPELLRGHGACEESDWWAWAATLLTALTSRPPFGGGTQESIMRRVLEGEPDVDGLPADLAHVFTAAFAPDPQSRYTPEEILWCLTHRDEILLPRPADTPIDEATTPLPLAAGHPGLGRQSAAEALPSHVDATVTLPSYDTPINRRYASSAMSETTVLPTTFPPHPGAAGASPYTGSAGVHTGSAQWAPVIEETPYLPAYTHPTPIVGLALMFTLAMLPVVLGVNGVIVAVGVMVLLAMLGMIRKMLSRRRVLYGGKRSSDKWVIAAQSPLLLLVVIVNTVIGMSFGGGLSFVIWWFAHPYFERLYGTDFWLPWEVVKSTQPLAVLTMTDARPVVLVLYGFSVLIFLGTWLMPMGKTLRDGISGVARLTLAPVWARIIFVLMLAAVIASTWMLVSASTQPWMLP